MYTHTMKIIHNYYYYRIPGPYIFSKFLLESFPLSVRLGDPCASFWFNSGGTSYETRLSLRAQPGGLCLWTHIAAFVVVGPVRKDERGHREGTIALVRRLSEVQAAGDDAIVVSWDGNRAAFHIPEPGKSVKWQATSELSLKPAYPWQHPTSRH